MTETLSRWIVSYSFALADWCLQMPTTRLSCWKHHITMQMYSETSCCVKMMLQKTPLKLLMSSPLWIMGTAGSRKSRCACELVWVSSKCCMCMHWCARKCGLTFSAWGRHSGRHTSCYKVIFSSCQGRQSSSVHTCTCIPVSRSTMCNLVGVFFMIFQFKLQHKRPKEKINNMKFTRQKAEQQYSELDIHLKVIFLLFHLWEVKKKVFCFFKSYSQQETGRLCRLLILDTLIYFQLLCSKTTASLLNWNLHFKVAWAVVSGTTYENSSSPICVQIVSPTFAPGGASHRMGG